jgi:hypothetical protein
VLVYAIKTFRVEVGLHCALDGDEWLASRLYRIYHQVKVPQYSQNRRLNGPQGQSDGLEKK